MAYGAAGFPARASMRLRPAESGDRLPALGSLAVFSWSLVSASPATGLSIICLGSCHFCFSLAATDQIKEVKSSGKSLGFKGRTLIVGNP